MGAVAQATRENFDELVESGTTLVDVWGPDCRPCPALKPHVEKLAEAHAALTGGRPAVPGAEAPRREARRGPRRPDGRHARGAQGPTGVHPPQGSRTSDLPA